MAEEVSNKTIAILVAVVLVISVVGTWTLLSQESEDLDWVDNAKPAKAYGTVKFSNNPDMPDPVEKGQVTINKDR